MHVNLNGEITMKTFSLLSLFMLMIAQAKPSDIQLLQQLQGTVNSIAEKTSPAFLYMEISHNSKGKTQAIPISGILMDDKGHVGTLYLDQKKFVSCNVWIDEQEYTASYLYSDKIKGFTILKLDSDAPLDKLNPAKFGDPTLIKNGEFLVSVTPLASSPWSTSAQLPELWKAIATSFMSTAS